MSTENTPKNTEMGTTEGEETMSTETPDTILVPSTPQPAPKQRRSYTAVAAVVAALAIGGLGGVVWQQHTHQPVASPETPRTLGDLAPERIDGSSSIRERQQREKVAEIASEWPDDHEKLVQQHPTAVPQRSASDLESTLFDARCAAAGGDTLYSNERRCTVDLPPLPGVPAHGR